MTHGNGSGPSRPENRRGSPGNTPDVRHFLFRGHRSRPGGPPGGRPVRLESCYSAFHRGGGERGKPGRGKPSPFHPAGFAPQNLEESPFGKLADRPEKAD